MGGARCLTCSETLRECRLRLGAPKFLFHADRINQIAAATAVACTDRSTSRWKQNQRANRKRKRSRENFNLDYKAYDLTKHLHPRPPYLTSYIVVRYFQCDHITKLTGICMWLTVRGLARQRESPFTTASSDGLEPVLHKMLT